MAGLYSHTTRAAGSTLTANIYNTDHQNHIDNHIPAQMDDYSVSVAQMQTATDPYPADSESQATSMAGELERLRFAIAAIKGTTHWYEDASLNLTSILSLDRNAIINGNFDVWQRGTSFTGVTTGDYTADRWVVDYSGSTLVADVTQETSDLPVGDSGDSAVDIAISVDVTTAENAGGAMDAGDYLLLQHIIEGYNSVRFGLGTTDPKTMTLSFYVWAAKTGTYCISFRNSADNRSYVSEYTISSASTWEKKTVTVTADDNTGTWLTTNGIGLVVCFTIGAGSTYHGTNNTWEGATDFSTSNQVNGADAAQSFKISQVQLELGSVATSFEHEDYATTLTKCQRYYEKTFEQSVAPAQSSQSAPGMLESIGGSGGRILFDWVFATTKRGVPTVTTYNPNAANADARNVTDLTNEPVSPSSEGEHGCSIDNDAIDATHAGDRIRIHAVADAEL